METIKKIMVGKLFEFYSSSGYFVILDVRKFNGMLQILYGYYDQRKHYRHVRVCTWTGFNQTHFRFVNRSTKVVIRKCLKTHPEKLKYHIGLTLDLNSIQVWDEYKLLIKTK